ncbi:hypothetical protein A4A49_04517 [Nicotiana attenuata]|uniref:Uncharacterized protein n=1 Tax=Nicotiana attenuata TaxID=49451 RepID=A0A1J6HTG1_NICAT|nr:hypothetical protein A4A49_04517 [Nicotiana attenuata]
MILQEEDNQKLELNLRLDIYNEAEEDELAATSGDFSPKHSKMKEANQGQAQVSTGTQHNNGAIGKEIVPVDGNDQQGKRSEREEVIPDVVAATQQIQITNMFAALEGNDGANEDNNQLVVVEDNSTAIPATNSPIVKKLNPTAAVFTPKSTGVGSTSMRGKENNPNEKNNTIVEGMQKESTAVWVSRTFNEKIVATNQSCQEIPSQTTEIDAVFKVDNVKGNLQLDGRKVWSQQVEEDQEEGELPEGASGEEESSDEENDQEDGVVELVDGQVNKVDGTENIGVSDSIQSCDNAGVGSDSAVRQSIAAFNERNATLTTTVLPQQLAIPKEHVGLEEIKEPREHLGVEDLNGDRAKFLSISKEFRWMRHICKQTIRHNQRYTLQHTRIQAFIRNSYSQAKQKSKKKQKLNQKEEEKTDTLKKFYKIHSHSQGNLSSLSAILTGAPTCTTQRDKRGRRLSSTPILIAGKPLIRCDRQDSAGICSGTNHFQSAASGNRFAAMRKINKRIENSSIRRRFREEMVYRDGRYDRGKWSEKETRSVMTEINELIWVISDDSTCSRREIRQMWLNMQYTTRGVSMSETETQWKWATAGPNNVGYLDWMEASMKKWKSYSQAKQKSKKEKYINQKEEEKTVTLKTFYKIHSHIHENLSSISAFLNGTPTCTTNRDKQGRLLSSTFTPTAEQSFTRCDRSDSAGIRSGTNHFQAAAAGHGVAAIRKISKRIGDSRIRMRFKEENLDRDGRYDRSKWSEKETMSVRIDINAQMRDIFGDSTCSRRENRQMWLNVQCLTRRGAVTETGQQIQTTNKFAALQAEEEGDNGNQMIIVEADVRHDTQRQKDLNPNASVFIPKSTGVASSKRGNVEYDDEEGNIIKEGSNKGKATTVQKEATTAWVNRIFAEKIVATNQSCQDIPSQDTEVDATIKEVNANERLQISGTSKENKADQGEDIEVINQKKTGTGDQPDQKLISSSPIKELPPAKPNIEPDIPFAVDTGTEGVIIHIEGIGEEHGKSKEDAAGDNVKNTKMLQPSDEGQKNSQRSLIPNPIGNQIEFPVENEGNMDTRRIISRQHNFLYWNNKYKKMLRRCNKAVVAKQYRDSMEPIQVKMWATNTGSQAMRCATRYAAEYQIQILWEEEMMVMLGWAAEEFNWASKSGLRHLQMDISGAWIKVKWLYVQYTDGNADGR